MFLHAVRVTHALPRQCPPEAQSLFFRHGTQSLRVVSHSGASPEQSPLSVQDVAAVVPPAPPVALPPAPPPEPPFELPPDPPPPLELELPPEPPPETPPLEAPPLEAPPLEAPPLASPPDPLPDPPLPEPPEPPPLPPPVPPLPLGLGDWPPHARPPIVTMHPNAKKRFQ